MRVMVTGCSGYIGTVMVPMLREAGYDVVGMDSDLYSRCTYFGSLPEIPLIKKDIRDAEISDLKNLDAILHLAALSNDPLGDLNPQVTFDINHLASVRLAEMAKKAGVRRFIFSSTCSVYGASDDRELTEISTPNPVTAYAESKLLAERDISRLSGSGFAPTFLRSSTAYGVSPRIRFHLVLNNLVAWAYTTGKVMLKSDGTPWRPIVHIEDIARAFKSVLEADEELVNDQVFNVGRTGENYRIRELAEIARDAVPGSRVEFAEGAGPDKRNYRVRADKLPGMIPSFRPRWDARKGARELYAAYRRHGLTLVEFEGPRFKRIEHLKQLLRQGLVDQSFRPMREVEIPATAG